MDKKVRTGVLSTYNCVNNIEDGTFRDDQDVQRLSGQWNAGQKAELIRTILGEEYIPPIIIGEETVGVGTESWLIDGLQRLTTIHEFKKGLFVIPKKYNFVIDYLVVEKDENGKKIIENGHFKYTQAQFELGGKSFSDLPLSFRRYMMNTI